jgi:hypothetical protein
MPQFTQPGHRFGPAEGLLDALADALGDAIAGMAGGAAVNGGAAPALVLRDMGIDGLLAQFHDKVIGVVALVGAECDRLRPVGMRCDQRQCRQLSRVGGNRSSCPGPAVHDARRDRLNWVNCRPSSIRWQMTKSHSCPIRHAPVAGSRQFME